MKIIIGAIFVICSVIGIFRLINDRGDRKKAQADSKLPQIKLYGY